MTYTLHYASQDGPGADATWSVYSEQYESIDSPEPIDGSQVLVASGLPDEDAAHREARRRQVRSYAQPQQSRC